jgi:hypothetical protein
MAAAHPLWFACSVLAVVASANLLACSVRKSVAVMAWLAALTFALWSVLAALFFWGAA